MIIKAYNGHNAMKIWREEIDRMGCEADEAFYRELIGRCDDLDLAAVFVKEMKSKGALLLSTPNSGNLFDYFPQNIRYQER